MPLSLAWEVTDEDIEMALRSMGADCSPDQIQHARDHLQADQVERAALSATEFDEQVDRAQSELKQQLSAWIAAQR